MYSNIVNLSIRYAWTNGNMTYLHDTFFDDTVRFRCFGKQCRSRWAVSQRAVPSGSALFTNIFMIFRTEQPYFMNGLVWNSVYNAWIGFEFKHGRIHVSYSGVNALNVLVVTRHFMGKQSWYILKCRWSEIPVGHHSQQRLGGAFLDWFWCNTCPWIILALILFSYHWAFLKIQHGRQNGHR